VRHHVAQGAGLRRRGARRVTRPPAPDTLSAGSTRRGGGIEAVEAGQRSGTIQTLPEQSPAPATDVNVK
jgi:hypothetical protein